MYTDAFTNCSFSLSVSLFTIYTEHSLQYTLCQAMLLSVWLGLFAQIEYNGAVTY